MKKSKRKLLNLNKLVISKLNNPKDITGGSGGPIVPTTILRSRFPNVCNPTGLTDLDTDCNTCNC